MTEIEELSIELAAMRGVANGYKLRYENAMREVDRLTMQVRSLEAASDMVASSVIEKVKGRLAKDSRIPVEVYGDILEDLEEIKKGRKEK